MNALIGQTGLENVSQRVISRRILEEFTERGKFSETFLLTLKVF